MAKFKVNETVCVKDTFESGVIKSIERVVTPNGETKVEYVVKHGEGFSNWKKYNRKQLEHFNDKKTKDEQFDYWVEETPDSLYKILLVGIVDKEEVQGYNSDLDRFYIRHGRILSIGYSICNPSDKYNFGQGLRIAKHRSKKCPFCKLTSAFGGEFNHETVMALLEVKGKYIAKNIEKFVQKEEK